jgi:uncharacterized protein YciI
MHYLLFYQGVEKYAERRAAHRPAHLEHIRAALERGELVQAGAYADPVDGSVLLFRGDSPAVAEEFARQDPFVQHGFVERWWVREWTTIVGAEATTPLLPEPPAVSVER